MILFWLSLAQAEIIDAWEQLEFGDGYSLDGYEGWTAGWSEDLWEAKDGRARSSTDEGAEEEGFPGYGGGTAADNWLIRGDSIQQGATWIVFENHDDDAFGLVSNHSGDSFYLVVAVQDDAPPPHWENVEEDMLLLYRVSEGVGEVLAEFEWSIGGGAHKLEFEVDNEDLLIRFDMSYESTATDPDPLPAGQSGFYAYNCGTNYSPCDGVSIGVGYIDEDADGVADDSDNCESIANEEQKDGNEDGIGDACDDDSGGEDTGPDAGQDDEETKSDSISPHLACVCAGTGSPALPASWLVLLTGFLTMRRR